LQEPLGINPAAAVPVRKYDASDLEDRYETRLRAMIEAS